MTHPALGLQLYTVRNSELPLDELLAKVAAAGYDGVEVVGTHGVAPERLRDALAEAGLRRASAHVPLTAFRTDLPTMVAAHRKLGTPLLVVPWLAPEDRPGDLAGWRVLGRELDGYGRALVDEGFVLAYHHHDFELAAMEGSDGLTALLEAAAPEHVSLELDTGWWAAVGRDPAEIERTTGVGTVFIRDDRAEAERLFHEAFGRNRVAKHWEDQPVGTPEDVVEMLAPYVELGYRHLIAGVPADYDEESMTRFVTEVKPKLEAMG